MNTIQKRTTDPKGRLAMILGGAVLAIAAVAAVSAWLWTSGGSDDALEMAVYTVRRGPLTISITERGTIKNREKVIVKCKAEGRNTIISLVEEGTIVKKGDLLIELDSSKFEENKLNQEISVTNAEAGLIRAQENLAVRKNQAQADVEKAELELRFAKLDLQKYLKGEHPQELKKAENEIKIAKAELLRAEQRVTGSERLEKEGYLTRTELDADKLDKERRELDLGLAETNLTLLKDFTHKRKLAQLESDVRQAGMALERAGRKASADVLQADADLKAKESEFNRQKSRLKHIMEQIDHCTIRSPVNALVVFATTAGRRWWRSQEPLSKGQEVRERQDLFHLPTAATMMAEIKLHESFLKKVKPGLPVQVTIKAASEKIYRGTLAEIAPMPDAQSAWMNPELKVFNTEVHLEGQNDDLRPGMSCSAEIVIEEHDDVLFVPIQCVQRIQGKPTVYVQGPESPAMRVIETGLDNNRMIHVLSGLAEGEDVLLAPPLAKATAVRRRPSTSRPSRAGKRRGSMPGRTKVAATRTSTTAPTSRPGRTAPSTTQPTRTRKARGGREAR